MLRVNVGDAPLFGDKKNKIKKIPDVASKGKKIIIQVSLHFLTGPLQPFWLEYFD